jgi:hypothetical protein
MYLSDLDDNVLLLLKILLENIKVKLNKHLSRKFEVFPSSVKVVFGVCWREGGPLSQPQTEK